MDRPTYIIDPDGEVIIELRNANPPFAVLDEDTIVNHVQNNVAEPIEEPVEESSETSSDSESTGSEHSRTYGGQIKETIGQKQRNSDEDLTERRFRIQVSAKHLTLVSPVFKKMLTGGWKENVALLQKGSVEIIAEGWDIEALLILLRVMHCQHNHVPRKLSFEMLAKVTVLADYYECRDAMGVFTDIWIKALEHKIPTTYSRGLIMWLWISWFFQLSSLFQEATSTAMSLSNGRIDNLGLPIPDKVLESMNDCRELCIDNIVILLHEKQDALLSGIQGCSFECSSIMYGALTKQIQSNRLLSPRPVAPFLRLNYKQLVQSLLSFQSPQWSSQAYSTVSPFHSCDYSSFESIFGQLNDSIDGLQLDSLI
ncbi:hypothetical protein BGW36DRAFT_463486 [Talaromyces proteolyticus]|uniref:BTB domain-containing protein n=1 Tax=Talaromyces proteolyticus TaxID=1131652 RepID=A0AAD4KPK7_9EURO|nr:uncharacterized protein BGW36DRAFT_463486 [Talaromyces proteolyticus]KAH8693843.1 hypothetical protein BGW36DRAFT_463486 [Talaromyces proteolyticus]